MEQHPQTCTLCGKSGNIKPAGFQQLYSQGSAPDVKLPWWECSNCRGWFVFPVPSPEVIGSYWTTIDYNHPVDGVKVAETKVEIYRRILNELAKQPHGQILDIGSNFGHFLLLARDMGWTPVGFEPGPAAAEVTRRQGVETYVGWQIEDCGFQTNTFSAVVSIDAFCYVWHPYQTLQTIFRALKPGGKLVMRITNKRFPLGLARRLTAQGSARDKRITRLLQAQFHSIGLQALSQVMSKIGFSSISISPRASTGIWKEFPWQTRLSYVLADVAYYGSGRFINLYPGVLVSAVKPTAQGISKV